MKSEDFFLSKHIQRDNYNIDTLKIYLERKIVNFEKMISRDYLERLKKHKANTYVVISPNYDKIKPKVIMKVKFY